MATPFLKWAGGKRWFVSLKSELFPTKFNTYFEPFLGAGAVFFAINPEKAVLSDLNKSLILTYKAIKEDWKKVKTNLDIHHQKHSKTYYYETRKLTKLDKFENAAQFIYLNRTCFNGIYRVNSQGEFNVPIGTNNNVTLEKDNFEEISNSLSNVELLDSDFETVINRAKNNDFLFVDPPYTVRHNNNGFISYNEKLFSWDDQKRLAKALKRAKDRGVKLILTNADNINIKKLYEKKGFYLDSISRYSSISAQSSNRRQFDELLVCANLEQP